ncbi:TonB-dependent receptor [Flaviaesturariibacter amylovorans]|uniref:TonB-dependent receptor n=1 Tax=Flaviaesturariibacter amylovorans TaxID=1084520 RepID=A0ABP8GK31_9BACT
MKLKFALVCALLSPTFFTASAQEQRVTGRVIGANNEPVSGATVSVKGTSVATTTDAQGNYTITVPRSNSVLRVSHVGMEAQELSVGGQSTVNVTMSGSAGTMNEVVVVGYGQQRRGQVTTAVSSVKAEQLQNISNTRLEQALQGRVSGVQVSPTGGAPGAGLNIAIRGIASNRGTGPIYIIDGVKAGGMESIAPQDIASIDILKDAAGAAIYGSEAANGVVFITTKMGRRNTARIEYSGQYVSQSARKDYVKMMNAQQYAQYLNEAGVAGAPSFSDVAGIGAGTNWLDAVLQTAPQQQHTLAFSGGTERTTYYLSGNIFTQDGIAGGDAARFNRYTVRFNMDNKIKSWLNTGLRFTYSHHKRRAISDNNEFGSILGSALVMDPTTPVTYTDNNNLPAHVQAALSANNPLLKDPNGNYYGISRYLKGEYGNPLARIEHAHGENKQHKIIGSFFAEAEPVQGLKLTSRFGIDGAFQMGHGWTPTFWFSEESKNAVANGYDYSDTWFNWLWENFATYNRKFGRHNLTLLGGVSAQKNYYQNMGGSYSGLFREADRFSYGAFVPDDLDRIGSYASTVTLASFFGRVTYDYDGRYLLQGVIRRDGSSKPDPSNLWETYPGVSAGWVLSNERFFPSALKNTLSYTKLRASWGQNGSVNNMGLGEWMNRIATSGIVYPDANGNLLVGAAPSGLANPELSWETSEQLNIGTDLGFLNNRLNISIDWYKKQTKGLLTSGVVPLYVGNFISTVNAGTVQNKGWDFEATYRNPARKASGFTWEISANLSTVNNEVTYLDPNTPLIPGAGVGTGWTATAMEVGKPIWYFQGYRTDGIFQTQAEINNYISKNGLTGYAPKPGEPIVVDVNGDKIISPADMTQIGSALPDFTFGARMQASYKGFDFLVLAQGQKGNDILMGFNRLDRATANKPEFFYSNRWTGPGSTNTWFAPNASNPYIYNSDLMVFDGSFVRIRQLQLGYTLPQSILSRARLTSFRVFVSLDDFFTFTKYPGVDPEGGNNGGNSQGIDRGGYPIPRKAVVGLNLSF